MRALPVLGEHVYSCGGWIRRPAAREGFPLCPPGRVEYQTVLFDRPYHAAR